MPPDAICELRGLPSEEMPLRYIARDAKLNFIIRLLIKLI